MAERIEVKLNPAGVRALLKSSEIQADLRRRGRAIASAAGPGHRVDSEVGRNRARVEVVTETFEAMAAEAKDRNLTRAVDAGR